VSALVRDAASAAIRWVNRTAVIAQSGADVLAKARVINQTSIWNDSAKCWEKRVDRSAWQRTLLRWGRRAVNPAQEVIYTVAPPVLYGHARPSVLHVIPNISVGGSTQLVVDLHNHLGRQYKMEVITSKVPQSGEHRGIVIHRHGWSADAEQLAAILRARKPDLVHVHYWGSTDMPWYDAVFAAADATNQTVLQNINTPVAPYNHDSVAMNVYVSNFVRALDTVANKPAHVIYPGIDLNHFAPRPFEAHAEDSIGMVYRLEPDKLNLQSIEPFIAVAQRRPQTRVFIIGDGHFFMPFVERVKAAGVFDNFIFTGALPYAELPSWYARFKLFVAPVWQESFGQVAPFAMAMGLAVAGHCIGALPEILDGSETLGLNLDDTVNRSISLLDDPERLRHVGELNRVRANQRFGVDAMAAAYGQVYAELLSRRMA
jgi:glycosyltransferase involved in cell wall biosynthesis